ncbi:sortase (surface protein transpeptidase) [Antricoccus suffuscus]|uniref:Sortase (Surface protein transpeptidase) n=1 Tax=Antricoccus suffuscus TaxID=1629062 RepID=A0A2T1A6X5_9ACTN|nr:class F sortase [Antricoccus suffuscus]PRZ44078.1 sortase (surface protein transpeptidase) [Antricoccus suffuscus]
MPTHRDQGAMRRLRGRRGRLIVAATAIVLLIAGIIVIVVGVNSQQQAPMPSAAAAGSTSSTASSTPKTPDPQTSTTPSASAPAPAPLTLPASPPTHIDVPAIGVSSDLLQLGTNPDGTVQVPPLEKDSRAGWFTGSPTPGQLGPSIVLGHIDSKEYGPGVFFKLGALKPGDQVSITRTDATVAVFNIDKVAQYPKNQFPTIEVYGNTDHAALRLITCGGKFDFTAHSYEDNIVVFASLASTHPA